MTRFLFELRKDDRTEKRFECEVPNRVEALRQAANLADKLEAEDEGLKDCALVVREADGRFIGQLHLGPMPPLEAD